MGNSEKASRKTETLNMRVSSAAKASLKDIGHRENRSMANALEWLVAEYYRMRGIEPPETAGWKNAAGS